MRLYSCYYTKDSKIGRIHKKAIIMAESKKDATLKHLSKFGDHRKDMDLHIREVDDVYILKF